MKFLKSSNIIVIKHNINKSSTKSGEFSADENSPDFLDDKDKDPDWTPNVTHSTSKASAKKVR